MPPRCDERPTSCIEAPIPASAILVRLLLSSSSQDASDGCFDLAQGAVLDEINIGTTIETSDPVSAVTERGQHDDPTVALLTNLRREVEPVSIGQHSIKNDSCRGRAISEFLAHLECRSSPRGRETPQSPEVPEILA